MYFVAQRLGMRLHQSKKWKAGEVQFGFRLAKPNLPQKEIERKRAHNCSRLHHRGFDGSAEDNLK